MIGKGLEGFDIFIACVGKSEFDTISRVAARAYYLESQVGFAVGTRIYGILGFLCIVSVKEESNFELEIIPRFQLVTAEQIKIKFNQDKSVKTFSSYAQAFIS